MEKQEHDDTSDPIAENPAFIDPNLDTLLDHVDRDHQQRFLDIVELIDPFCDEHLAPLEEEYRAMCQLMAANCCQPGTPIVEGRAKPESWAAGIVWTIGWVNFLSDPTFPPVAQVKDISAAFGVSDATVQAKSRDLRNGFDITGLDPDWTLPPLAKRNPLLWLIESASRTVDARTLSVEAQQVLVDEGLIPFVVDDYDADELDGSARFAQLFNELTSRFPDGLLDD